MPTFLTPSFWFSLQAVSIVAGAGRILLFLFLAMVLSGVTARIRARGIADRFAKTVWRRAARLLVAMGLLGLVFAFFGYEDVQFLGARFWYLAWFAVTALWAASIARYALRVAPVERLSDAERRARDKYLPPSKK
jgi:hypothetical protein